MKVLCTQLEGPALAYAVAIARNLEVTAVVADGVPRVWPVDSLVHYEGQPAFNGEDGEPRYLTEHDVPVGLYGGPFELSADLVNEIIDEHHISTLWQEDEGCWWASMGDPQLEETIGYHNLTRTGAAMQEYVQAMLGELIEIPDVLVTQATPAMQG